MQDRQIQLQRLQVKVWSVLGDEALRFFRLPLLSRLTLRLFSKETARWMVGLQSSRSAASRTVAVVYVRGAEKLLQAVFIALL